MKMFVCSECGSDDVEQQGWIGLNVPTTDMDVENGLYNCNNCNSSEPPIEKIMPPLEALYMTKAKIQFLIEELGSIINDFPNKGDTCEASQKVCLANALQEFNNKVNGLSEYDLYDRSVPSTWLVIHENGSVFDPESCFIYPFKKSSSEPEELIYMLTAVHIEDVDIDWVKSLTIDTIKTIEMATDYHFDFVKLKFVK